MSDTQQNIQQEQTKNVETRVAETILEKHLTVAVGKKTYDVAPPTLATLILASEIIARLPRERLDPEKLVQESFHAARHSRHLAELTAVLILGAQFIRREQKSRHRSFIARLWAFFTFRGRKSDTLARLTDEICETQSPRDIYTTISKILTTMQLADFFGLTTFLTEVNLLHQTKVGKEN